MSTTTKQADFTAMSRLSADIDLLADGKATGFVRVPHSVHRSAYGWIPIPIVRIKNGSGPSVVMQAGTHGDEWEGQVGLGNLIRSVHHSFKETCFFHTAAVMNADGAMDESVAALMRWVLTGDGVALPGDGS